jgi:hypothetical protein
VENGIAPQILQYRHDVRPGPGVWTLVLFVYALVELFSAALILVAEIWLLRIPNVFLIPLIIPAFWMSPVGFIAAVVNTILHFARKRRRGAWMVLLTLFLTTAVPPVFIYLVVKYD